MTQLTPYAFGGIRSAKDPIFAPGKLLELAWLLCGLRDRRALFAWCAREGVGLDSADFRDGTRRVCDAWLDARRQHGVFFASGSGRVVATLENGKVKSESRELRAQLTDAMKRLPPAGRPPAWVGAPRGAKAASPPQEVPALSARVVVELSSRAGAAKLTPLARAQLTAASKELCGKKGLPALFAACDETGQGLALVELLEGKAPRFSAWLTAALEDGVFFDHGKRTLNGLAVSQGDVHDMKRGRAGEVAALQRALKKLRAPRARAWRG